MAAAEQHSSFSQPLTPDPPGRFPGGPWQSGKLNPSRVSWVCPEVSSLLAMPGGGTGASSLSKESKPAFSVEKIHFIRLHLDLVVITTNSAYMQGCSSETEAYPDKHIPKALTFGNSELSGCHDVHYIQNLSRKYRCQKYHFINTNANKIQHFPLRANEHGKP